MPKPLKELLKEQINNPNWVGYAEMARRLRALDERHQVDEPRGHSQYYVCRNCGENFPCPDRRILDGEPE